MFRVLFALVILSGQALADGGRYDAAGADEVRYRITKTASGWDILVLGAGVDRPDQALFVALGTKPGAGSPLLPGAKGKTGSAVWLPFSADLLLIANRRGDRPENYVQRWKETQWGPLGGRGCFHRVIRTGPGAASCAGQIDRASAGHGHCDLPQRPRGG